MELHTNAMKNKMNYPKLLKYIAIILLILAVSFFFQAQAYHWGYKEGYGQATTDWCAVTNSAINLSNKLMEVLHSCDSHYSNDPIDFIKC